MQCGGPSPSPGPAARRRRGLGDGLHNGLRRHMAEPRHTLSRRQILEKTFKLARTKDFGVLVKYACQMTFSNRPEPLKRVG